MVGFRRTVGLIIGVALVGLAARPAMAASATLDAVKARGSVSCGVSPGLAGFGLPDSKGIYHGLDADICRAVAAAVFGDASKVRYVPLTSVARFVALQSGEIDLLARDTTWTYTRSTQLGLTFTAVNYYDGQGFLVQAASPVRHVTELGGSSVCVQAGTDTEIGLQDYFSRHGMRFEAVIFETPNELKVAFEAGRCDVLTNDATALTGLRSTMQHPEDFRMLPEIITKEPLTPSVRSSDEAWANIVRWSFWSMVIAEELGVTSANAQAQADTSTDPDVQRLTGKTGGLGAMLGLDPSWALNAIKQVGNYGESFSRNLGPLGVERGYNRLWRDGGLMYAPPLR